MTRLLLAAALLAVWPGSVLARTWLPGDPDGYLFVGNEAARKGDFPAAIVSYRFGLLELPDDPQLRRGLDYARSRIALSPDERVALTPPPDPWAPARHFVRLRGPLAATLASVLGWLAVGRWVVTRRGHWLMLAGGFLGLTALLAIGWQLDRQARQREDRMPFAVLMQPTVLRRGDGTSFLPRRDGSLPAGVEVRVVGMRGRWIQIELAEGAVGWVPEASINPDAIQNARAHITTQ